MVSLDVQVATKHASDCPNQISQSLNVWATEMEIIAAVSMYACSIDFLFFIIRGHLQMAACEMGEDKKHKQSF